MISFFDLDHQNTQYQSNRSACSSPSISMMQSTASNLQELTQKPALNRISQPLRNMLKTIKYTDRKLMTLSIVMVILRKFRVFWLFAMARGTL